LETTFGADECVIVDDELEKFYYIKECTQANYTCDYTTAAYGTPAKCIAATTTTEKAYPGETCTANADCHSNNCDIANKACIGKDPGFSCVDNRDCVVGYYCKTTDLLCEKQSEFDQACVEDNDCVNNCVCNSGKCIFQYSAANEVIATNTLACISGRIVDGKCAVGLKSKYPGNPCTNNIDCDWVNDEGVTEEYGVCTCGYNPGGFSYCTIPTGDTVFSEMVTKYQFIIASNLPCHTLRRTGPCSYIHISDESNYKEKKLKFEEYPLIIGNDKCISKVYTTDYWSIMGSGLVSYEYQKLLLLIICIISSLLL